MTPQTAATELVDAVSAQLGVEPKNIRAIDVTPHGLLVTIFETDANGRVFIASDGLAAQFTRRLNYRYP